MFMFTRTEVSTIRYALEDPFDDELIEEAIAIVEAVLEQDFNRQLEEILGAVTNEDTTPIHSGHTGK